MVKYQEEQVLISFLGKLGVMMACTWWAILLLRARLVLGVEPSLCVQVGGGVVGVVIIVLTLSHWVLPPPAPGEEWEKYPHQRVKTVSCQV